MPSSRVRSTPVDRDDEVVVEARLPGGVGELVRAGGELVLPLPRDREPLGQQLVGLAERDRPLRRHPLVDQPPAQRRRDRGDVAGRERPRRLGQHPRRPGHRLHAAGEHHVGVARLDGAGGHHRGVQRRAAEPVDGRRRHRDRQPGQQHRHPADVAVVLAGLVGAAPDHVADRGRVQARRLGQHRGQRGRGQVVGAHPGQRAAEPAERGAGRGVQEGVSSSGCLLEHLLGDPERGVGVGYAAVDRGLQEHLLDLVDGEPVGARGPQVQGQLLVVAAGDQRGEGDHRAAAPVEAGAGPDRAPGVLGDELLEVAGELGGVRRSPGRRGRRRAPRGAPPCRRRTWSCGLLGQLADDLGDLVGRLGGRLVGDAVEDDEPAVLHAVGDLAQQAAAGRPGRRRRPPPAPARRSRPAGRGRRTPRAPRRPRRSSRRRRRAARAAAPRRAPARGRRSPAPNQRLGRSRSPATRCPTRGPRRPARATLGVADLGAGAAAAPRRAPGRVRRAAAAARPGRRPSRRRRGTGRRPRSSTRAARSAMVSASGTGPRSRAVARAGPRRRRRTRRRSSAAQRAPAARRPRCRATGRARGRSAVRSKVRRALGDRGLEDAVASPRYRRGRVPGDSAMLAARPEPARAPPSVAPSGRGAPGARRAARAGAATTVRRTRSAASPTRRARRRPAARRPAGRRRGAGWRRAAARSARPAGPGPRAPGCACAASSTSRRRRPR